MNDVKGYVLGPPHSTTPAAVTTNNNIKMSSFNFKNFYFIALRKPKAGFSVRFVYTNGTKRYGHAVGTLFGIHNALLARIEEVEGLYYLCSEDKGAYQLRDYHAATAQLI